MIAVGIEAIVPPSGAIVVAHLRGVTADPDLVVGLDSAVVGPVAGRGLGAPAGPARVIDVKADPADGLGAAMIVVDPWKSAASPRRRCR